MNLFLIACMQISVYSNMNYCYNTDLRKNEYTLKISKYLGLKNYVNI